MQFEYELQPRAQPSTTGAAVAAPTNTTLRTQHTPVPAPAPAPASPTLLTQAATQHMPNTTPPAPQLAQPAPPHALPPLQRVSAAPAPALAQQQPHPPFAESVHLVPPPATPDTDLNPFEHEPLGFEERRREAVVPYDLSLDGSDDDDEDESDEEHGQMSQLLPGSGIF